MSHSPHPEFPGFSPHTGQPIEESQSPCYMVTVHLMGGSSIVVTPTRRRAPLPEEGAFVTICWMLTHPDLEWADGGVEMKAGWNHAWGTPSPGPGNRYELETKPGPVNKEKYPYTLNVRVNGGPDIPIDPEVEYDSDF